jgi:hypothetical protein
MSRWKAAGIHLSISVVIGMIVGALLFGVWYPPPYFHAAGADALMLLLVGVDLTLGPLLTLVVFKSGKRGLKFDLALIGAMQLGALLYGLSVVLVSRPVFLIGVVDRFVLVAAHDIDSADLAKAKAPEFRSLSWTGPRLAGTHTPGTWQERNKVLFSAMAGKDLEAYPEYYVEYADAAAGLLKHAKPLGELHVHSAEEGELLDASVRKSGETGDHLVWLPIVARKEVLTMLLDKESGKPLRAVAINPWH